MSHKNGNSIAYKEGNRIEPLYHGRVSRFKTFDLDEIQAGRRLLRAKTDGQSKYIEALNRSIVTMCAGVAGTGKTYIATAKAIEWYLSNQVDKIIFCRPAVPCGKGLGFLPGEFDDKFLPYIGPFQPALNDFMDPVTIEKLAEEGIFEFTPPDYMDGMTYNNAVMLLDEAQNATEEQLRMFMTRAGNNTRVIITGNPNRCNLNLDRGYAYRNFLELFETPPYVDGLEVVRLGVEDVVRSGIVQKIIEKIGE